jgi:NADPH-dependent glutamate synthase beta subunit-like oxidoreductase
MDRQKVQTLEAQCIEEQPPACTAGCPIHLDARALATKAGAGDFAGGFAILARFLPFPRLLSRLCDHPCEPLCKRGEAGEPLRIGLIERACVDFGQKRQQQPRHQRPQKKWRIGLVGAGLSGLTAAVDLAAKGHDITVFEAEAIPLPRLRRPPFPSLPAAMIDDDLAILDQLGIRVMTGQRRLLDAAGLATLTEEFDAVYLGPGPAAAADLPLPRDDGGRLRVDPLTFATGHPRIFAGGSLRRTETAYSPIVSVHDGRYAAVSIERLLQGASLSALRDGQGSHATRLFTRTADHSPLPAVVPADATLGYTAEEAQAEASRCLPCHCLECVKVCEFLAHHGAYPKRYIREIYNNDGIVMGAHKANRLANSCSLCGLCETVCPEHLSMAEISLMAREAMVDKGKMQPSFHDFALRDMAFSQSEAFALARHQPGRATSAYAFFPGCQLSASSPDQVAALYAHLCSTLPGGVGLVLGCCGAPAFWSGHRALFADSLAQLHRQWTALGRPTLVTACSSCLSLLTTHAKEMTVRSLWPILESQPPPTPPSAVPARPVAIHDPCTTRQDPGVRDSIRRLLAARGIPATDLGDPALTTCCGFGGLMCFVAPDVADKTVDRRAAETDLDILAYCAMCRDNFARRGKRALHLLDLILPAGADPAGRRDPGYSGRQENRARLKVRVLRDLWGEEMTETPALPRLSLDPEVAALAERRQILLSDIRTVIRRAEESGTKFFDAGTGHCIASATPHAVTYWVEYSPDEDGFVVHNIYSHRMRVGGKAPS